MTHEIAGELPAKRVIAAVDSLGGFLDEERQSLDGLVRLARGITMALGLGNRQCERSKPAHGRISTGGRVLLSKTCEPCRRRGLAWRGDVGWGRNLTRLLFY